MTSNDEILKLFLGPPGRGEDHGFAEAIRQQVLLEERVKAARRQSWLRFFRDAMASGVVVLLLLFLGSTRLAAVQGGAVAGASPTVVLALLLFAIWVGTVLRPSSEAA